MSKKSVLLTEIISPYRIPSFNRIAQGAPGFRVVFYAETVKERSWKVYKEQIRFPYEVLPGFSVRWRDPFPHFCNPTVLTWLARYSPQVILIGGLHHLTALFGLLYGRVFHRPVVLWCESTLHDHRRQGRLTEAYKSWFIQGCNKYLVPGEASRRYLESYGVRPQDIYSAPNAVDNEFFSRKSSEYKRDNPLRELYPYQVILYVGRVIQAKGVMDLVRAYEMIANQVDAGLLILGDGQDKDLYEAYCQERGLDRVQFVGFVHQEELPLYYALADVFVFPTHSDPWGFVLNEALACGLPVISTDVAGATPDLVHHGYNGYVFPKGDVDALATYLLEILRDRSRARAMGQESLRIVQDYSPEKCAAGFLRVIAEA